MASGASSSAGFSATGGLMPPVKPKSCVDNLGRPCLRIRQHQIPGLSEETVYRMGFSSANRVINYPTQNLKDYQYQELMNAYKNELVDLQDDQLSHYSAFSNHSAVLQVACGGPCCHGTRLGAGI